MPFAPVAANERIGASSQSVFVEARTADAVGDQARAARLFAALAEREPANRDVARRAVSTAIEAGETALALSVARRMTPADMGLDGRLLIVADLLARGRANEALGVINERTADADGGFLAPVLRGDAGGPFQLTLGELQRDLAALRPHTPTPPPASGLPVP